MKRGRGKGESPHFFFSVISQLRSKRRQSLASSPLDTHNWATPKPSPRRRRATLHSYRVLRRWGKKKKLLHKTSPQSLSHSRQLSSTWQSRDSHALCGSFCIDEGRSLVPSIAATGRLVSGSKKLSNLPMMGGGWVIASTLVRSSQQNATSMMMVFSRGKEERSVRRKRGRPRTMSNVRVEGG